MGLAVARGLEVGWGFLVFLPGSGSVGAYEISLFYLPSGGGPGGRRKPTGF